MEENNTENIEIENIIVPSDDMGDLIAALFQAGFSDDEIDVVLQAVADIASIPDGELILDEEIIKITDKFEMLNMEISDEDLAVIRKELLKRFQ